MNTGWWASMIDGTVVQSANIPYGNYWEAIPVRPDPTCVWNPNPGVWVEGADAAAVAANALAVDSTTVSNTAIVQQLINATDAQIATFVANHSTADAGTQGLIVLLARLVRILAIRSGL